MPNDREGFVGPASPQEVESWNSQSLRGVQPNAVNSEFGISSEETTWEYTRWHRTQHRNSFNQQCKLCVIDKQIKQQKGTMPPCRNCGHGIEKHLNNECPK